MRTLLLVSVLSTLLLTGCDSPSSIGGGTNNPGTPGVFEITTIFVPAAQIGVAYGTTLEATGGAGGYVWGISIGNLPAGLTLTAGGIIQGVPSGPVGPSTFTVQVTDSANVTVGRTLDLYVDYAPLQITSTLPGGISGDPYNAAVHATGGSNSGYTWSLAGGILPPGLTLQPTGTPDTLINGVPNQAGVYTFTVRVDDSVGNYVTRVYTVNITDPPLMIGGGALPVATTGVFYTQDITATGGSGAGYTWSLVLGNLPPGMTLDPTGTPSTELSGTPNSSGSFDFSVRVTDSNGNQDTRTYTLNVLDPPSGPPVILTTTLPSHTYFFSWYQTTVQASGGQGTLTWSIVQGALPPGLSISSAGMPSATISGLPGSSGTFHFTVRVEDAVGAYDTQALSITVHDYHSGFRQDVLLVADMGLQSAGAPNTRIRAELLDAVQNLNSADYFDIVVHAWNHIGGYTALWGTLMQATTANVATAVAWIQSSALDPIHYSDELSTRNAWEYSFTNYTQVDTAIYLAHRFYLSSGSTFFQDLVTWGANDPNRHSCFVGVAANGSTAQALQQCAALLGGTYHNIP